MDGTTPMASNNVRRKARQEAKEDSYGAEPDTEVEVFGDLRTNSTQFQMRVIEDVGIKVKRFRKRCMAFKTEANTQMSIERGANMIEMGFWIETEFTDIHTLMYEMVEDRAYDEPAEMMPSIHDLGTTVRCTSQWVTRNSACQNTKRTYRSGMRNKQS